MVELILKYPAEAGLALRNPLGIVLPKNVVRIADQLAGVGDRHAVLQKNAHESMTEPVWRWRFLERADKLKDPLQFDQPTLGDGPHDD